MGSAYSAGRMCQVRDPWRPASVGPDSGHQTARSRNRQAGVCAGAIRSVARQSFGGRVDHDGARGALSQQRGELVERLGQQRAILVAASPLWQVERGIVE